ncbi:MAG: hypothetical protein V1682_06235 [Candidatus Omnitrophota bacterium]
MNVYFKGVYTILGSIESKPKSKFQFEIPIKNAANVIVEVDPQKKLVESFWEGTISTELKELISQGGPKHVLDWPQEIKDETSNITSIMSQSVRKVLYNIKYWLRCDSLEERLFSEKTVYWSEDKNKWRQFSYLIDITIDTDYVLPLEECTAKAVKGYIQDGIEPLAALKHFHRAKKELIARYKWIDATIAAELAIKEFFILLKPDLEPLLSEVPSPPLYKLYGEILKTYTGQSSPYVSELSKGAERRNKLLHNPQEEKVSDKDALQYIHDVENAIYHLLTLLYPKDEFIQARYKSRFGPIQK